MFKGKKWHNFLSFQSPQLSEEEFKTQLSNQLPEGINISQLLKTIILYCRNTGKGNYFGSSMLNCYYSLPHATEMNRVFIFLKWCVNHLELLGPRYAWEPLWYYRQELTSLEHRYYDPSNAIVYANWIMCLKLNPESPLWNSSTLFMSFSTSGSCVCVCGGITLNSSGNSLWHAHGSALHPLRPAEWSGAVKTQVRFPTPRRTRLHHAILLQRFFSHPLMLKLFYSLKGLNSGAVERHDKTVQQGVKRARLMGTPLFSPHPSSVQCTYAYS